MNFLTAYHTDIGIRKKTNQDALCIKIANTSIGRIALAVICDGMGGLSQGELASALVIKAFSEWFENQLPALIRKDTIHAEELQHNLRYIVLDANRRLIEYGTSCGAKLGTTLTSLLIIENDYYIIHVGDSRAYEISEELRQLTKDHTLVQREVDRGNISREQAERDPRKNVLLQCVGASENLHPDFLQGKLKRNCTYMLCTDGFRHEISNREIYDNFNHGILLNEEVMKTRAQYLVELNKSRMEQDNISVLLLRTF